MTSLQDEVRRVRRENRHGPGAMCVLCAESALETLTQVSGKLIEQHHVLGRNHDSEITVPLCRNCHAKVGERINQERAELRSQPTFLEQLVQMLRCLAAFFRMIGETLSAWAKRVEELVAQLDLGWPDWRKIEY